MGNVDESHSFDVAEALEADIGNLHPEDEALIESVVATFCKNLKQMGCFGLAFILQYSCFCESLKQHVYMF
jgi:hypothetical protein